MTKKESKFLKHIACSACGSSDANSLYDDGHQYCFNCETFLDGTDSEIHRKPSQAVQEASKPLVIPRLVPKATKPTETVLDPLLGIPDRGITTDTCRHYQVKGDSDKHYYPYGSDIYKVRNVKEKQFHWQGKPELPLFGMDRFTSGGKAVTIVEGELDALAGFQMLGSKYPVVSIRSGASGALKDCKAAYEYLDGFDSIVICFDADEPGQKAAQSVAELFGAKAKVFKHKAEMKDACDYLKANDAATFVSLWWKSEQFKLEGVIEAEKLRELIKKPLEVAPILYPWDGLNRMLYGIRPAELVTFTAGSGLGKSTILRELVIHILKNSKENVGLAFLEETPERTMRGLIGLELNKKLHLPDAIYTPDEVDRAYDTLGIGQRVFLWDHFGSNEIDNVLSRLRYFVKALGCSYLVLDHLSILVSDQAAADERKNIDMVMTKLRMFVQEMKVSLLLVSHLKRPDGKSLEDGAVTSLNLLRGSGSIAQLSDAVISAERNSQAESIEERNTTKVRVLKSRYTGYTGHACDLFYEDAIGRLKEIKDIL
jgi:twinkle protein